MHHKLINKLGHGFWFEDRYMIEHLHELVASFGENIVPELKAIVEDLNEFEYRRIAALDVLCLVGGEQIGEYILELLHNEELAGLILTHGILKKLDTFNNPLYFPLLIEYLRDGKVPSQHVAPAMASSGTIQELIELLDDVEFKVREATIIALGIKGDFLAIEPLINMLHMKEHYYWLSRSLEDLGHDEG